MIPQKRDSQSSIQGASKKFVLSPPIFRDWKEYFHIYLSPNFLEVGGERTNKKEVKMLGGSWDVEDYIIAFVWVTVTVTVVATTAILGFMWLTSLFGR